MSTNKYIAPKTLWQAAAVVALGCFVGLFVNFVRPDGLHLMGVFSTDEASEQDVSNGLRITIEEAEGYFLAQMACFLDTREMAAYEAEHIESAMSLPWSDFEGNFEKVLEEVEKDAYIITYCDGAKCNSSEHVAVALLEKGYSNVYVLFNGWTLWVERGLPTEKGPL